MNIRNWSLGTVLVAMSALLIVSHLQRDKDAPATPRVVALAPAPAPTTAPSIAAPTTQSTGDPAATQPIGTLMTIDQRLVDFPQARLRLMPSADGLTAVLFSADPPTAIDDDYSGNSFYLTMPLTQVKDPAHLDGAAWRYRAASSERQDTHEGIFLQGLRYHLQPQDVMVTILADGHETRVELNGQFLSFDAANKAQLGMLTPVSAEFPISIETKTPAK